MGPVWLRCEACGNVTRVLDGVAYEKCLRCGCAGAEQVEQPADVRVCPYCDRPYPAAWGLCPFCEDR